MQENIIALSEHIVDDDFRVEFEVSPIFDLKHIEDTQKKEIYDAISSIEDTQKAIHSKIESLNEDIDRLTNHADGIDYTVAVSCGILCGIIDSLFVGEFDYEGALKKSQDKVNEYVKKKAEKIRTKEAVKTAIEKAKAKAAAQGKKLTDKDIKELKEKVTKGIKETFEKFEASDSENGTVNSLRRAISKLEGYYKIASDNMFKGIKGMNTASHHLDDLAHHPTLLGFCAAIIGEFFKAGIFVDKNGDWHLIVGKWDDEQKKKFFSLVFSIVIAALLRWMLNSVTSKYKDEIDEKLPKPIAKILKLLVNTPLAIVALKHAVNVFDNWWGHLASDMAGSSNTPGAGMGIPGLFVCILKEISSISPLNYTKLPKLVDEIYTQKRFDMRDELAVINELGRQCIPVLLGDVLTRTIYFVRHLVMELHNKDSFMDVDWKNVIPFNNRTITRLLVIESGTFTTCDIADAAIRSAIQNGGNVYNPELYTDFILRVNIVGIGRFAIALGSDIKMVGKRKDGIDEKIFLQNKYSLLDSAIVSYKQEGVWLTASETASSISHLKETACKSLLLYNEVARRLDKDFETLNTHIQQINESDPEFSEELLNMLD